MEEPSARLKAMAEVLQIMTRTSLDLQSVLEALSVVDDERDLTLRGFSRPVPVYNVVAPTEAANA